MLSFFNWKISMKAMDELYLGTSKKYTLYEQLQMLNAIGSIDYHQIIFCRIWKLLFEEYHDKISLSRMVSATNVNM